MACYGIDLGTTYSCIAKMNVANLPELISDIESGERTVPSAILFNEDGTTVIGKEAKEEGKADPARLCQFFKRYIGRDDLMERDREKLNYLTGINGKTYNPIELSSMVLQKLVDNAKNQGEEVHDVVITCPAYFNNFQREATKKAGEDIGLHVLNIINEPTAAAASYFEGRVTDEQTVLVYDLGGGTFDVSIIRMTPGKEAGESAEIKTLTTNGDDLLGGKDWDDALYELLKKKFSQECEIEVDDNSEDGMLLRGNVEEIKKKLSGAKGEAKARLENSGDKIVVTREEFEKATAALLERTFGFVEGALTDAGLTREDITKVLMVGGSTRMPAVQMALKERFGEEKVIFNNPDEAVALGAAFICNLSWGGDLADQIEKGIKTAEVTENADGSATVTIKDAKTGEVDQKATEEANRQVENGALQVQTNANGISLVGTNPGYDFTDGVPRTIGIVVMQGEQSISDNVLLKGETAPRKVERDYYTYEEGQISVQVPVLESLSKADSFNVNVTYVPGNLLVTADDPALDLHMCDNMLALNFDKPMPKGSRIHVIFTISKLGEMEITAEDVSTHKVSKIDFKYSKLY